MAIQVEDVQQPLRKLRKQLKDWPDDPAIEEVHKLRTETRRIEAIAAALRLEKEPQMQRLLKEMTPVRKAAGKVRDLDVLAGHGLNLAKDKEAKDVEDASLVRLMEQLGAMRAKAAADLQDVIAEHRKDARYGLAQSAKQIQAMFAGDGEHGSGKALPDAVAVALEQASELGRWPRLTATNIHRFRIEVKKLRSMLQLSADSDAKLVDALGQVKDAVGEWHDWLEFAKIAEKVLDAETEGALVRQLKQIAKDKLKEAMAAANSLRRQYLGDLTNTKTKGRKPVQGVTFENAVLKSAAALSGVA